MGTDACLSESEWPVLSAVAANAVVVAAAAVEENILGQTLFTVVNESFYNEIGNHY